jgi:predicted chitinase
MNCEKNASDIRDLKKKVFGNGRKGLDDRMTIIEEICKQQTF